jgi:hypothetical protein
MNDRVVLNVNRRQAPLILWCAAVMKSLQGLNEN